MKANHKEVLVIPKGFRKLFRHETVMAGDFALFEGCKGEPATWHQMTKEPVVGTKLGGYHLPIFIRKIV